MTWSVTSFTGAECDPTTDGMCVYCNANASEVGEEDCRQCIETPIF